VAVRRKGDEQGPSSEDRRAALEAVGGSRTLAEWLNGAGGPPLFAWTAVAPSVDALLAGWRGLPEGWMAVTPSGDLADGRGLVVLRGRADSVDSEAARRHARRRELAQALERIEDEQEHAAADAAKRMAAVTEAARALDARRADREAAEVTERTAAEEVAGLELRARRASEASTRLTAELEEIAAAEPRETQAAGQADAPPDLSAGEAAAAELRARRVAAAAERDAAREGWVAAQAKARQLEDRQLGSQRTAGGSARRAPSCPTAHRR